jgi:DNA N-6-adenine-methyltransferase (Dam).
MPNYIIDHVFKDTKHDEWGTPAELYAKLNAEFHFTLDLCASPSNAKCAKFYSRSKTR